MEDQDLHAILNPPSPPTLDPPPEQPSGTNPVAGGTNTTVSQAPPSQPPIQAQLNLDAVLGSGVEDGMENLLDEILDQTLYNPYAPPTELETHIGEAYTEDELFGIEGFDLDEFSDGVFNNPNGAPLVGLAETTMGGVFTEADLFGEQGDGGGVGEGTEQGALVQNQPPPFQMQIALGLIQLRLDGDENLVQIINQHQQHIPSFDTENMTSFERVVRSFAESFCARARRPILFNRLRLVCQLYGGVTPHVVRAVVTDDQLTWSGVRGQARINGIRDMAWSYFSEEDNDDEDNAILTDFRCETMGAIQLLRRLKWIHQVGPYRAFTILLFGLGWIDFLPSWEQKFRLRYQRFSGHLRTAQEIESELEGLAPYRGLAAWLIWKWA